MFSLGLFEHGFFLFSFILISRESIKRNKKKRDEKNTNVEVRKKIFGKKCQRNKDNDLLGMYNQIDESNYIYFYLI
jgi:hypothetical protein